MFSEKFQQFQQRKISNSRSFPTAGLRLANLSQVLENVTLAEGKPQAVRKDRFQMQHWRRRAADSKARSQLAPSSAAGYRAKTFS
jgi:hypothetical protein